MREREGDDVSESESECDKSERGRDRHRIGLKSGSGRQLGRGRKGGRTVLGNRRNGRSPYITPPLGTRVLMRLLESDFGEVDLANMTWGPGVFAMKFPDKVGGVDIVGIRPGVFFVSETAPRHKVLEFAAEDVAVHDFFDFPVFFAIDNVGFGNFGAAATGDQIALKG